MMLGYVSLALLSLLLLWLLKTASSLRRNIASAKASGLPYVISPIDGIAGFLWTAIHDPILNVMKRMPFFTDRLWHIILEPHRGWNYAEEMREKLGDAFLIVSPYQIYMNVSDPGAINDITTRRNDFLKPVEIYGIVDIFGSSMLSSEGDNWKRHRKVVAPAFSERSNALVWKESLTQASGMLHFWSNLKGNSPQSIRLSDAAPDIALMTLHVISGAGFGVRQVWDSDNEEELGTKAIPGFNTTKLEGNHRMPFKTSLNVLLDGIIWMAIFPSWLLRVSPLDVHKKLMKAYSECGDYFTELFEHKIQQLGRGEKAQTGTMDLMGPLVKASKNDPTDAQGQYMTKQDVIANSWIFLFAGHETTANTTHFAFLFLAMALDMQALLQTDVDHILGSRSWDDWAYDVDMGRLSTGMVCAAMNEALRLMPPIIDIPKIIKSRPQPLSIEGRAYTVPINTFIHLNAVSVHRHPKYWPHAPSKVSEKAHDLDDFVPTRWLPPRNRYSDGLDMSPAEGLKDGLFAPIKGSFIPFSEGARACPGRRFAQIEMMAVLALVFKKYSLELEVNEWATDEEVEKMGVNERREVYEKAKTKTRKLIRESETIITLQMLGTHMPVRLVERGKERFIGCYI